MGNFPLFVYPSCDDRDCEFRKLWRAEDYVPKSVIATPGFFSIDLKSGMRAEITATEHVGFYRFSFLNSTKAHRPVFLADASDLAHTLGPRSMFVDADTGQMKGEGTFRPSFGEGTYNAYFCADFKGVQVNDVGGFTDDVFPGATEMIGSEQYNGQFQGVYARFKAVQPKDKVVARVGLSWLSSARACENAEREIKDWNFERVHEEAVQAWRKKLEPIKISSKGVAKKHLRNFWSGIYRAFLSPQDYTGENQLWDSMEPYYDSWYCIWDTFRGVHPFYTLVDPISQSRMVRSLIDIWKHAGWLPEVCLPKTLRFCLMLIQSLLYAVQDVILQRFHAGRLQCRRCTC